jgi:predicted ATPase
VDLPERQRTLRATVEWSVGLLTGAERSLLEVAAVFTDGWTIQAAAAVADLEEDRALELSEALARHPRYLATSLRNTGFARRTAVRGGHGL